MGDGGSGDDPGNRAQDPTTLRGKMLRIDVSVPDSAAPAYLPLADRILEYDHTVGAAVIGGVVYRGQALGPAFESGRRDPGQRAEALLAGLGGNQRFWSSEACSSV